MKQKKIGFGLNTLYVSLLIILPGCGQEPEEKSAAEMIRPVKTMLVASPDGLGIREFPGRVEASKKVDLAFRVSGEIVSLPIKEGDHVQKEQLLASLDKKDFQIAVNDKKASFDRAEAEFKRGKELIKEGYISKTDYDKLESNFKTSKAQLEAAQQQLGYTELKAPFSGFIGKKYVDNHQEIQAKEPMVTLQDLSELDVTIDVAESVMIRLKRREESDAKPRVYAKFDNLPGKEFDLTFSELSTKADEQTQTYAVGFSMPATEQNRILPGMTAMVVVDTSSLDTQKANNFYIPANSVVANSQKQPMVWVVDEKHKILKSRAVKVGKMSGKNIIITEGIETGDRIVIAGVNFLRENMKVTLMTQKEQAR